MAIWKQLAVCVLIAISVDFAEFKQDFYDLPFKSIEVRRREVFVRENFEKHLIRKRSTSECEPFNIPDKPEFHNDVSLYVSLKYNL